MASVVKRKRKDGSSSWYARYRDGRGKDVWEKCRSAREARSRAAEIELLLARSAGAWMPPAKVTVAEYAERWLAERGPSLRPHTLWSHRRIFDKDCERRGLTLPGEVFDLIVYKLKKEKGLDLASFQPKFIVDQVVATCRFMGQAPHFEPRFIDYALNNLRVRRNAPPAPAGADRIH